MGENRDARTGGGQPHSRTQLSAVILSTLTAIWMLAPSFPMVWAPEMGTTFVTWHSWADPLTLGYLLFPPVILAIVVVTACLGWYEVARKRATLAPAVFCGAAIGMLLVLFVIAGVHPATVVPALTIAASATLHLLARRP